MSAASIVRHRMTDPSLSPEGLGALQRIAVYLDHRDIVHDYWLYVSASALLEATQ